MTEEQISVDKSLLLGVHQILSQMQAGPVCRILVAIDDVLRDHEKSRRVGAIENDRADSETVSAQ